MKEGVFICILLFYVHWTRADCPAGWTLNNNRCYYMSNSRFRYSDAVTFCGRKNATIVTFSNSEEWKLIIDMMKSGPRTNYWIGLTYTNTNWAWIDKTPYNKTAAHWMNNREQKPNSNQVRYVHCAYMYSYRPYAGKIQMTNCRSSYATICKRSADTYDLCNGDDGWIDVDGKCFKLFDDKATWDDARSICRKNNGDLYAPQSQTQIMMYGDMVDCKINANNLWTGFSDRARPGVFLNTTNQPMRYMAFASYYPRIPVRGNSCLMAVPTYNFYFAGEVCSVEHKFVCVKPYGTCPSGWLTNGDRCYQVHDTPEVKDTWFSANRYCISQGTRLLTIKNNVTEAFITRILHDRHISGAWLGYSDQKQNDVLTWTDGVVVNSSYTDWDNTFPNLHANRSDCGIIKPGAHEALWSNGYCYHLYAFICEISIHQTHLNSTPQPPSQYLKCNPGWFLQGTSCYRVGPFMNWTDARSNCTGDGADLTTVTDEFENSLLIHYLDATDSAWIGLKRDKTITPSQFFWVDNNKVTFSNFFPFEPRGANSGFDCVEMLIRSTPFPGSWNDNKCSLLRPFVCKTKPIGATPNPSAPPTVPWSYRCGPDWVFDSSMGTCYKVMTADRLTWTEARADCRRRGSDLVSIDGPREHLRVEAAIYKSRNGADQNNFWIGANDQSKEGGWEWSDGWPFRYLRWHKGQPNDAQSGEDCGEMVSVWNYEWNDRNCNDKNAWICKKLALPPSTVSPVTMASTVSTGHCRMEAMISGVYSLPDKGNALTSSSYRDNSHKAVNSRLYAGNTGAWSAKSTAVGKEWIAATFYNVIIIHGVIVAGRADTFEWVSAFKLQYQYDYYSSWYWYEDPPGTSKVFQGNSDAEHSTTVMFSFPIEAKTLRLVPTQYHTGISLRWEILGCVEEDCMAEYGISGPLFVDKTAFQASSTLDTQHSASYASLNPLAPTLNPQHPSTVNFTLSCWKPKPSDSVPWIQVNLGSVKVIRGITTRGSPFASEWVSKFKLSYKVEDGSNSYTYYQEPYGTVKIFSGNSDSNTSVTSYLKSHIKAQLVRVVVVSSPQTAALRFDLLVCPITCREIPLISGPHPIPDTQLNASSYLNSEHGVARSRLNLPPHGDYAGAWEAEYMKSPQYIQADLGRVVLVTAVSTQGRADRAQWVTSYKISYSSDYVKWYPYFEGRHVKIFSGNWDQKTVRKHYLVIPISARYVRLWVVSWHDRISLRWELYGCPGPMSGVKMPGCYADLTTSRDLPYEPLMNPTAGMWPPACIHHCYLKGYFYAGLQAGYKCFCGNSYGKYGISAENCSMPCFPHPRFKCGGEISNIIYSTGLSTERICQQGWLSFGDNCYFLFNDKRTWTDARANCQLEAADLVSVNNQHEQDFVVSLMAKGLDDVWIGFNDLQYEMLFEWTNEKEVKFTNWDVNQPDTRQGTYQDCVFMSYKTNGWQTSVCTDPKKYICMSPKRPAVDIPTQPPSVDGCEFGWDGYRWSCYLFVTQTRSWFDATAACKSFGATLVRIDDRYEQAYLASALASKKGFYWSDITDKRHPGLFTMADGNIRLKDTNWAKDRPDQNGHCVAMGTGRQAGLWYNSFCNTLYSAVCERPRVGPQYTPPTTAKATTTTIPCAPNWVDLSGYCYQVNSVKFNLAVQWSDAQADCLAQGSNLASFHNASALDYLWRNYLIGANNNFWIGLNLLRTGSGSGQAGYSWSDGSSVDFLNWNVGEPSSLNGEDQCVEVLASKGKYNDQDCHRKRNWICAVKKGHPVIPRTTIFLPTAGPPGSCGTGWDKWMSYKNFCYFVGDGAGDGALTWRQARHWCQEYEGELASITNMGEEYFVWNLIKNVSQISLWIGLSEVDYDYGYRWSDGNPVSLVHWSRGEPNDYGGEEACADMLVFNGKWNDEHCSVKQGFVCKRYNGPITTPKPTPANLPGYCPAGFNQFGNKCYRVFGVLPSQRVDFKTARSKCRSLGRGYDLASITNFREQAYVTTLLSEISFSVWIGLVKVQRGNGLILQWIDNEDLTFTNWDIGEPNGRGREKCVEMYSVTEQAGEWNDAPCTVKIGYVCQTRKKPYITTPEPVPNPCDGNPGFKALGEDCFRVANTTMTWSDASSFCSSLGAYLPSINNPFENAYMTLLVTDNRKTNAFWIGLSDLKRNGTYEWVDKWPVVYTKWNKMEPAKGPGEGCVSMDSSGQWTDDDCSKKLQFACKIPSGQPPFTVPPLNGLCVHPWVPFGSDCYLFHAQDRVRYEEALFQCLQHDADLVSIHSNITNSFLLSQIKKISSHSVWIGLYRSESGGFSWHDNSPLQYTNWSPGEPTRVNKRHIEEHCGEMFLSGAWNDVDCNSERGYICQRAKDTVKGQTFPNNPEQQKTGLTWPNILTNQETPPLLKPTTTHRPASHSVSTHTRHPLQSASTASQRQASPTSAQSASASASASLGKGGVAAVVIGCMLLLIIVAAVVYFWRQRHRSYLSFSLKNNIGFENQMYNNPVESTETET